MKIGPKRKYITKKYIIPYLYVNAGAMGALCVDAFFRQANSLNRKFIKRVLGYHYDPNLMLNFILLFSLLLLTGATVTYFKPMNRKGAFVSGFGVIALVYFLIG